MALVVTNFLDVFKTLGTRTAIIQIEELSNDLLNSVFILNSSVGLIISVLLYLFSPLVGWIYKNPEITQVIGVLGLIFFISSFDAVPRALMNRQMNFRTITGVDITGTLTYGLVSISLAFSGFKVWSLVLGMLARSLISTILFFIHSHWRPRFKFKYDELKKIQKFSSFLSMQLMIQYFVQNSDNFIIGRVLGSVSLGYYDLAYRLFRFPVSHISGALRTVLLPAFSKSQKNDKYLREKYLRASGAIASITIPLMINFCVLAEPIIFTLFGKKWEASIPLLIILAPAGTLFSISSVTGLIYTSKGRTDLLFYWDLFYGAAIVTSFCIGVFWGINGVATAYAIASFALAYPGFIIPFKLINLSFKDFLRALIPYLKASTIMGIALFICKYIFEIFELSKPLILISCSAVSLFVYAIIIMFINPPALRDFRKLLFRSEF